MLSAVITALLVVVMLLIMANLIVGARREHQRHQRALAVQSRLSTHPLDNRASALLQWQEGAAVGKTTVSLPAALPATWYTRRRTLVSLGFMLMIALTLLLQDGLAGGALQSLSKSIGLDVLRYSQPSDLRPISHPVPLTASVRLVRIDSTDRNQYANAYQWNVWAYSSCSGIAMAMVMNAYGRHLTASDVLQEEANLGVWDVHLGLLREEGIAMTASYFGFDTSASHARTLQDIIAISNKGAPVIISVRDNYYFPGGHLFVIRGGDSQYVYTADSSIQNFKRMSLSMFTGMWQGFSAVMMPR